MTFLEPAPLIFLAFYAGSTLTSSHRTVFSREGPGSTPSSAGTSLLPLQWRVAFTLREPKPDDFETLWRVDQECFPPGIAYSRQELKVYMRRKGAFTVVAEDFAGGIAGFIVAHPGTTGHVITIDVLPSARRSGLGSQLLRAAEARLRTAGSMAVGLEAAVDNVSALSFYKRHGYDVIKTWPRYYSNGVDALVLKKDFTAED